MRLVMRAVLRSAGLPLALLFVALVGLGVLEYRWTEELARAEEDRMRAAMHAAAGRFSEDLGRELGRLILVFRPAPWQAPDDPTWFDRQLGQWTTQAGDPRLLRGVMIASGSSDAWELRRLDGDRFVPAEWTAELEPVRARLDSGASPGPGPPGMSFVPEVPAIVIRPRPPGPPRPDEGGPPPPPTPAHAPAMMMARGPVVVLVLDAAILRDSVLRELAERHFAGLDADVAVVTRAEPRQVVWTSRPDFPGARPADVTMALLGAPWGGALRAAAPWPPPSSPHTPPRVMRPPAPAWQLVVAHRDGSLAAVVARTRARNLALGLGVLALLGGSGALLALYSHRARALARQQVAFVAAVSHELRTPLAAIRSAGENLADGVVTTPEQVRRYGEMLRREGDRLTALVERTLELSGMLGRSRRAPLERIDVAALVSEVLAEARLPGHVEVDVAGGLEPIVGDAAALKSALRNLIDNAQKHGGGEWLAVRARMAPEQGARRELDLVVEDRGPGVPRAEVPRLFEPFVRGASARGVPGSGLGLSVVQHVARAHGGRVTVATGTGGRGAAFTLSLPAAREGT